MATLLHIDSSVLLGRGVRLAHRRGRLPQGLAGTAPDGTVVYRDLAAEPVPHITAESHTAGFADPATHSSEQAAAFGSASR